MVWCGVVKRCNVATSCGVVVMRWVWCDVVMRCGVVTRCGVLVTRVGVVWYGHEV